MLLVCFIMNIQDDIYKNKRGVQTIITSKQMSSSCNVAVLVSHHLYYSKLFYLKVANIRPFLLPTEFLETTKCNVSSSYLSCFDFDHCL